MDKFTQTEKQRFGPEWEKEMMELPKKDLINILRDVLRVSSDILSTIRKYEATQCGCCDKVT